MISKKLRIITVIILAFAFFAVLTTITDNNAYAECDHQWDTHDDTVNYSNTQHKIITYYYCYNCGESKEESSLVNHTWKYSHTSNDDYSKTQHKVSNYYYCTVCDAERIDTKYQNHSWYDTSKHSYKKKSETQHTYHQSLSCKTCYHWHEQTGTENHKYNRYNECKGCYHVKAKNITLSAGKAVCVNDKSWVRINVKKKGFLAITVNKGKDSENPWDGWYFCNSKKQVFTDQKYNYGASWVPVKKGTYYIRPRGSEIIKYTWKKDPSKKNYTKGKSAKLKKKKAVMGAIYPSDSKKTFTRYYKVKLTKKQFLRFTYTENGHDWRITLPHIIDSKGRWYNIENIPDSRGNYTQRWTSSEKLKKGTYYIVVEPRYTSASKKRSAGMVFSIKWY